MAGAARVEPGDPAGFRDGALFNHDEVVSRLGGATEANRSNPRWDYQRNERYRNRHSGSRTRNSSSTEDDDPEARHRISRPRERQPWKKPKNKKK